MGNPKICDCCMDFTSLLQSYDGKRVPISRWSDVGMNKEEVEMIILYMQSWTQRQCSCCFRDSRNFERFNWALQVLIMVVIEILRRSKEEKKEEIPSSEEVVQKEPWDVEEKEKLVPFVAKIFLNSFPTYVAYKQHYQLKSEEVSPQEVQALSIFCEISEPEASVYLFRNVSLFCKAGGMEIVTECFANQTPETLPIHQAHVIVALASNVKTWINYQISMKYWVPFRANVLSYMSKLVDTEQTSSARNMGEFIWISIKEPIDTHGGFDKDGLDLAFKYFLSSTLTLRISGVNHINNHINLFNEAMNSEQDGDHLDHNLAKWLLENQIIEHIFGPNLHVEVIKQTHTILTFLAMEGKITNEHIDIIWAAAQLKHCSKPVYDILSSLICNMEAGPVLHLHTLLWKLEPREQTEQSLYLASALIKFIWTNAVVGLEPSPMLPLPSNKRRYRGRVLEFSSSESPVSVEASQSEDELIISPLEMNGREKVIDRSKEEKMGLEVGPCRMFKSGQLREVLADSSEEESMSGGDSGKSEIQVSSSGYIETHSDSDADEERSGGEDTPKVLKRKILKRKKGQKTSDEERAERKGLEIDGREMSRVTSADIFPEEPKEAISELSNLVNMTDTSLLQEFASPGDLDGSEGSYSTRISNKSEKNMADFDGEDSPCEEDIVRPITQDQIAEMAQRDEALRLACGISPGFGPRPVRHMNRRRRFQGFSHSFNFQLEDVCQPGQTLLWDLIQDEKIGKLSDALALEAQKALTNLLCFNTDKQIRLKFVEGCIENLANNRSVVISLRLLPKLLTSFQNLRMADDIHTVTMWAERDHNLMSKFFGNLKHFKEMSVNVNPFSYQINVQTRLQFLSVIFSLMGSPEDFRLSIVQVDELWDCLARDSRSSDDLFIWFAENVRSRDQHALSSESLRYIFIKKLPSLPPESISMHTLNLFQQLCNMARTSGEEDVEAAAGSMDYLWKIALCANSSDVSKAAIQYLNSYYMSRQLEKEKEFISRCMAHLGEATEELSHCNLSAEETPLIRIQRALQLLKTHLETFRRRYAYHLKRWSLAGAGVGSHAQLVGEKGAVPIRVVIQPAGYHEKVTLDLLSTDYVADMRAEVANWWENIQTSIALEKSTSTPVLGSLLTEGPIRMITQGIELSAEHDEKFISEVPIKDLQLVYVSMGVSRGGKKKDMGEFCSSLPPPPRDKLPVILLLQPQYFEQLFSLMHTLSSIKIPDKSGNSVPHTKAQVLSRRVWDILMLLPTNPVVLEGFTKIRRGGGETPSFSTLLDPSSPQKLMYSLYIVEAQAKINPVKVKQNGEFVITSVLEPNAWRQHFIDTGGLRHLFDIFLSGVLEIVESGDWSEWKQDSLASLLKILCYLGVSPEDTESLNDQLYDVNEIPKKKNAKKKKVFPHDKTLIPRLNDTMLKMMDVKLVMTRLTNILQACSLPRDPNHYKTGFWGRAQVVHYAMALLVCWAFSNSQVRPSLYSQKEFPVWLKRLVLEDPEPAVRREVCTGFYRLCLGISIEGKTGISYAPELISHLLKCLNASLTIKPQQRYDIQAHGYEEGKEPYGPACRDYFWLLGRLLDSLEDDFVKESIEDPDNCVIDLDGLARILSKSIVNRDYLETRHNTVTDDGLVGLVNTTTFVMKHNPPFKNSKEGQQFLKDIFEALFALPSPQKRYYPKCKSFTSRSSAYDLLAEMSKYAVQNYYLLQNLLMDQHQPSSHGPYPWDYWPHEDGRSSCGYVGLTNLGATCYMASCMQHLYMLPQARASILNAKFSPDNKHDQTLRELQRMFAYLMESERKAYNPRSFCKVYQMEHQPLNNGEQKDMTEFFTDLVAKLEEMTPELKKLVKNLFCGVTSNNVVSLDCSHVSRTLEEFYTVRCQVADMRNLYESLNEVTVKDTLEGDNMYTCSQCGKKVRAEKRACFKKLPRILCFNTMRYTFNMITMIREKVNTHFSFPFHLDMSGYVEKSLMPQQVEQEKKKRKEEEGEDEIEEDECFDYDLIGVTVHTGTAEGGHYYSFIRDRVAPNKDKWFLFNDAEVKPFDPNQIAAECFGGEMSTKTYDSVTDKFMDFSFEKSNSAYMLFYERCSPAPPSVSIGEGSLVPALPGGSSQKSHMPSNTPCSTMELTKELEDWIWQDNMLFLKDKNIFEHNYFNFLWQACSHIPGSLMGEEDVHLLSAKLAVTFFLETFIHAKEKPTMVQWVELLTKQLAASQTAAAWLLDHMAETDWWPVQILLKCPNQMVRQMFQRLCIHVIQQLRPQHYKVYLKLPPGEVNDHPNDLDLNLFGSYSCITRFIKRLLLLLEHGAKSHLKHLTEYFSFLHDFSKLGDDECLFLINMQAISKMVNFYLGNKKDESGDHGSEEEEEDEEVVTIPAEKNKLASLEKMIALVASLVEKSRDENNSLKLSTNDWNALTGTGKHHNFPFIMQQIRDGINYTSTRNMIFSLCRWNDKLAEDIIAAMFQNIQKHPDSSQPYFKVLNLLAELVGGPPGMPPYSEFILNRILDVADLCSFPTLEWLVSQVPRNKIVHRWCLTAMDTWVEHFLISHNNQRVRNAAASLLVSLVPNPHFRQGYRTTKMYMTYNNKEVVALAPDAMNILHEIYIRLLNLLKPARHYTDASMHGTSKLTAFFAVLTYFTISKAEKQMAGGYLMDLWHLFHPKLSEPCIPCHHNKQALLAFWHHVCLDCPENIQKILQNSVVTKQIAFNYILADHEDQEVVMYNRSMLPYYYSILRMCCESSRTFASHLTKHQNISWAFKNISPYPTQYPTAVEELFKMMQIFVTKHPDATEQELAETNAFRRNTLQLFLSILDGRSTWSTLISSFRTLIETIDDKIFVVCNNGLNLIFETIHNLHAMHHEATACHVTSDIVELLNILTDILKSFRPKDFAHSVQVFPHGEIQIHRYISISKEWPEVLRKLATLLNTFNPPELRSASIEALMEFLYVMPNETLRTLIPLMFHCHSSALEPHHSTGLSHNLGPYYPKRSHSGVGMKPSVRPPRPMLQMAFPHVISESMKILSLEDDHCRRLQEFFSQYHVLIDLMCRIAFMKELACNDVVTLSAMVGLEALPLHFIHFPKLWIEIYNTVTIDRKYLQILVNTEHFHDFVNLTLIEDRSRLNNIVYYNFLATYLPKIFDTLNKSDKLMKTLKNIVADGEELIAVEANDVESFALKLLSDAKALTLFYLPSMHGKGNSKTPLRSPAPTIPQLKKYLTALHNFLTQIQAKRLSIEESQETPSKKRKLDEEMEVEEEVNSPQPSTVTLTSYFEQTHIKNYIAQDLFSLMLGVVESLSRSFGSAEETPSQKTEEKEESGGN